MGNEISKISNEAAAALINNFSETDPEKMKALLSQKLDVMLANGEISEKDKDAALKYINKNNLAEALAGRNKVEGGYHFSALYGDGDLEFNSEADALMKASGLNIHDLYEAVGIADADYKVQEKELTKIQQLLNDKIRANGSDMKLSKKDAQLLMEGMGLQVKRGNILARALSAIAGDSKNKTERAMADMSQKADGAAYVPDTHVPTEGEKIFEELTNGNSEK